MILFHTAFKFGGIVSVSFWSMVAVVASGVIGRFIYLQIPRSIEGRELSLGEVKAMKADLGVLLKETGLSEAGSQVILEATKVQYSVVEGNILSRLFRHYQEDRQTLRRVKGTLRDNQLGGEQARQLLKLVRHEITLNRRIERLQTMQQLFRYWHVAHLPFALIMLVIMIIHVVVTVTFGARWLF
jgi:hypothetical protein